MAIPGPFGYQAGVAHFAGVGKFESLNGVDLARALRQVSTPKPHTIEFLNDAEAFTVGEWVAGAARGAGRVVGITLGTGVGSAFLDHGHSVSGGASVPPEGRVDLLHIHRKPLEETISTRAIVAAHGARAAGVQEIADEARAGHRGARSVLNFAFIERGIALAPWLRTFGADALVLGGSNARAFDLLEPPPRDGLRSRACHLAPQPAENPETPP